MKRLVWIDDEKQRVVPKEATEIMIRDAEWTGVPNYDGHSRWDEFDFEEVWSAMLAAAPAAEEAQPVTDERNGFDVALNALAEFERNWDTGAEHPYAEMSRIEMEGACEAVRGALNEARAARAAAASKGNSK